MNWKFFILITLLVPCLLQAQSTPHKCGVDAHSAAIIKQRLMDNRAKFTKQEIKDLTTNRTITYVPVTITNVANTSGVGRTPEGTIFAFLCGLNTIYASQDVQFFLQGQIRNVNNNYVDGNAFTGTASVHMSAMKVSGTLNLIIGRSTNNQSASFYSGAGDYVFLLQAMLSAAAKTEAHEIGHFFTLNHTFYGWEGRDVDADYGGGNVPFTVGSGWGAFSPEKANRTGSQSNCTNTADGFCDTPADYYSDRKACPYSPQVSDPHGNAINPDESNLMSYALDNCVTGFSPEQEAAIAMDIAARSWVTNTPTSTTVITGAASAVTPLDNDLLGPISNPTLRLDWTDVPGATWYYLEVYGTNFFGFVDVNNVIFKGLLYSSDSHYDIPTNNLVAGQKYTWRTKALNSYSTCANYGAYTKFEATTVFTDIKDLPLEQQMSFDVTTNPITTSYIPLSIYSAEEIVGSIRIYSMDGREALTLAKQNIAQGNSLLQLPADELANGVYVAVLATDRGFLQQKLVIQR